MRRLQRGDDPFQPRKFERRRQRFLIGRTEEHRPPACKQMCMKWPDTRIIQTCRDAVRLDYLPVLRLHDITSAAMQHTRLAQLPRSGALPAMKALSRRLYRAQ